MRNTALLDIGQGEREYRFTVVSTDPYLGKFDAHGKTYWIAPTYPYSAHSSDPHWRIVGKPEQSRRSQRAENRTSYTAEQKAAMDKQVWNVLKEYGSAGASVSTLVADIFENRRPAIEVWSDSKRTGVIQAALSRLEKRKLVTQFYGSGLRRAEVKVYEAIGHYTDPDPAGAWDDSISDVVSVDRHADYYSVIFDDGSTLNVRSRDLVRQAAQAARELMAERSNERMANRVREKIFPPYPRLLDVYFASGEGKDVGVAVSNALKPIQSSLWESDLRHEMIRILNNYHDARRHYGDYDSDGHGNDPAADKMIEGAHWAWGQSAWKWYNTFEREG